MTLAPATFEAMTAYDWPGNVRELQNCMERAVLLTDGDVIMPAHLNLEGRLIEPSRADPWDALDLSGTLDEASRRVLAELERRKLGEALAVESGDRQRAAARLGVTPAGAGRQDRSARSRPAMRIGAERIQFRVACPASSGHVRSLEHSHRPR